MNTYFYLFHRAIRFCVLVSLFVIHAFASAQVLVLAPHPDDDLITASGVITRALQDGVPVKVVYVTNGDLSGGYAAGYQRQGEAVAGESCLALAESNLIFLGYPDGGLQTIQSGYTTAGSVFVSPNNISATYGNRGLGGADYHTYRFGSAAAYNLPDILQDLEDILRTWQPRDIFVTGPYDLHTDHSATYQILKLALAAIHGSLPGYAPVIHATLVHWEHISNPAWPNAMDSTAFVAEPPDLETTPLDWSARESLDVPLPMQSPVYSANPKYLAINAHASQGGVGSFLGQFIHKDEIFWNEPAYGSNPPPVVDAGLDQVVSGGQSVHLDGSRSSDPGGAPLTYQWTQKSGVSVSLQDPGSATPGFTAPPALGQDDVLSFELVVSDGTYTSIPDAVSVTVPASGASEPDIAGLASVAASSQNTATGQTAAKAVDGVIAGYPGDYTREWATVNQGTGAWIQLTWNAPYLVDRVVLFDRPNSNDQILGGTLTFSDGSSVAVGALANDGSATAVSFAPRSITSLALTVTAVGAGTSNIGLSEIQVYGQSVAATCSLSVGTAPSGAGTVSENPNQSAYSVGQQVILTATPGAGYAFSSWSGAAASTSNPLTLTLAGSTALTANFTAIPGTLAVSPATGLSASGAPGGPFTPSSQAYTLSNPGAGDITWSATPSQSWITLSAAGGTLASGASTSVTVSLNANALNLGIGTYSGQVQFSNTSNGNGGASVAVNLGIAAAAAANIAGQATATASSQNTSTGQTAAKAVDGVIAGYPGDYTKEWATTGQRAGAWLKLAWPAPYLVGKVVLYDRPNANDQVLGGTLAFSDGSSVAVGALNNDGSATTVTFAARSTTSLTFTVTSASSATTNVGLAEIQVFGTPAGQAQYVLALSVAPPGSGTVTANPSQSTYAAGQQVVLRATPGAGYAFTGWSAGASGSANPLTFTVTGDATLNANFTALPQTLAVTPGTGLSASGAPGGPFSPSSQTYTLSNPGSGAINWSASANQPWISLSAASGSLAAGASSTLTVSLGSGANSLAAGNWSGTVTLTNLTSGSGGASLPVNLAIAAPTAVNIAGQATVTASSQNTSTGQTAVKAVDGVIAGYPGDYTREWATTGQRAGAWLKLAWPSAHVVSKVVLYDRPNANDQITAATLAFSDGTSLAVGTLNNDGSATTVTFAPKTLTSLTLTVTAASSSTANVGLAEIQVYGN